MSFEVSRGDVVLLLGPSGSGKSTLSLAMNGLIPHAVPAALTGRVEVAGMDAATHSVAATHLPLRLAGEGAAQNLKPYPTTGPLSPSETSLLGPLKSASM